MNNAGSRAAPSPKAAPMAWARSHGQQGAAMRTKPRKPPISDSPDKPDKPRVPRTWTGATKPPWAGTPKPRKPDTETSPPRTIPPRRVETRPKAQRPVPASKPPVARIQPVPRQSASARGRR